MRAVPWTTSSPGGQWKSTGSPDTAMPSTVWVIEKYSNRRTDWRAFAHSITATRNNSEQSVPIRESEKMTVPEADTMEVLMTHARKGPAISERKTIARRQFLRFLAGSPLLTAASAGTVANLLAAGSHQEIAQNYAAL